MKGGFRKKTWSLEFRCFYLNFLHPSLGAWFLPSRVPKHPMYGVFTCIWLIVYRKWRLTYTILWVRGVWPVCLLEIFGVNKTGSDYIFLSKETQHQKWQDGWCSTPGKMGMSIAHLIMAKQNPARAMIKTTPAVSLSLILTFFLTCLVFALLCQGFCQSSKDSLETVAGKKLGKPGTK